MLPGVCVWKERGVEMRATEGVFVDILRAFDECDRGFK